MIDFDLIADRGVLVVKPAGPLSEADFEALAATVAVESVATTSRRIGADRPSRAERMILRLRTMMPRSNDRGTAGASPGE